MCYRIWKKGPASLQRPQKCDTSAALYFGGGGGGGGGGHHESAPCPSSSISPGFITNVFTANQCNGLECVVCEHLTVCLTYISCWPWEMTGPLEGW